MGIRLDVPVVLNSVIVSDEFEGTFQERRFVIHTINFQMKVSMFGPQSEQGVITTSIANLSQQQDGTLSAKYTANGNLETGAVDETWIQDL